MMPRRLSTWLLAAQAVVLSVAAVIAAAAAAVVGPPLFHKHLVRAGDEPAGNTLAHVEEAFRSAGLITLAVTLLAAFGAATAVTTVLSRRLTRPLHDLAAAADRVAHGQYGLTVASPTGLAELTALRAAFNHMSTQLAGTEEVRQRLLSDLGHEMRTPLATMTVYLDAAEDGVSPGPEFTAVLREQVARLNRLSSDINDVSRAEESATTLERETIVVASLLASVTRDRADRLAARRVELRVEVDRAATVNADRRRLQQVLTNLLDNAERHTLDGGHIEVVATTQAGSLTIAVGDDGSGIAEEHLPHVFERFYRTDEARDRDHGGAGIGLAICRSLIHAHDGVITVDSSGPGRGTTLRISLPTP